MTSQAHLIDLVDAHCPTVETVGMEPPLPVTYFYYL